MKIKKLVTILILAIVLLILSISAIIFKRYSLESSGLNGLNPSESNSSTDNLGEIEQDTLSEDMKQLIYESKKNRDTIGFIRIPNTEISNPVLQSHNNSVYLRTDERNKSSIYGCYFADYKSSVSSREYLSDNIIVYGHSDLTDNPDGVKFSQLFRFTQKEFAEKTPYIYLTVPEEEQVWQIFAAFYTDIYLNYITSTLSDEEVLELSQTAMELSVFDYGVSVAGDDNLLTLSTCSIKNSDDGNQRFVVMAKLVDSDSEIKESINLTEK